MKPFYYSLIICGFGALVLSSQARAQDALTNTTTTGEPTYGQLAGLVSRIAILKAQAQLVQLQEQIAEAKRAAAAAGAPASAQSAVPAASAAPALPVPPYPASAYRPSASSGARGDDMGGGRPQILSITGRAGQLSALLLMPGGGEVEAVPGTLLNNGAVVRFVSPQSVQVIQNGKLSALPFAGLTAGGGTTVPGG